MKYIILTRLHITMLICYLLLILFSQSSAELMLGLITTTSVITLIYLIKSMNTSKRNWLFMMLMILFWGLGRSLKIFEGYNELSLINYELHVLLLFCISNVFLLLTVIDYFFKSLDKWNRVQLFADGIVITLYIIIIISGIFNIDLNHSLQRPVGELIMSLFIMLDIFSLLLLLIMVASKRIVDMNRTQSFVVVCILILLAGDIVMVSNYFKYGIVVSVTSDSIIVMAFVLLTVSGIVKVSKGDGQKIIKTSIDMNSDELEDWEIQNPENLGKSSFMLILLSIAVVLFIIGLMDITYLIASASLIGIYGLFKSSIQKNILTELLLENERHNKIALEAEVMIRTQELQEMNEKLEKEVTIDSLTGLYNRKYFYQEIKNNIDYKSKPFSILFIDLDRFKVINDIHGHQMGDSVLIAIADRFRERQSDHFKFARFGGDEFAIIVDEIDLLVLESIGNEISSFINEPIHIQDFEFVVGASIGIARYPEDATTPDDLLKNADIAMYQAKNDTSKENYVVHSSDFSDKIQRRNQIELYLKEAKINNDFTLYYQPQFDSKTQELVGMEALIRWFHPIEKFISPAEFIPIAEEIGMIQPISEWVFRTAIETIKEWNMDQGNNWIMSMNVSPLSLDYINFLQKLTQLIEDIEVDPKWLGFEITEHSAMTKAEQMEDFLTVLSNLGVTVSIDDFGTGYSSLGYLKRFDVDVIKIAKELIDHLEDDEHNLLIVKAIIMMSEGMGLDTVAEGVENHEQLKLLKDLNCDIIQGYVLGRPVSKDEFQDLYFAK